MRVVQAPCGYEKKSNEIACFMAGGCQNNEWQQIFINKLQQYTLNLLVLYNPYNPNIESPFKQIEWEYHYLNKYINDNFIFSAYFDKYTKQPMTMYELGRATVLGKSESVLVETQSGAKTCVYTRFGFPIIITIHPEAPGKQDLICQLGLEHLTWQEGDAELHAMTVLQEYKNIKHQMGV